MLGEATSDRFPLSSALYLIALMTAQILRLLAIAPLVYLASCGLVNRKPNGQTQYLEAFAPTSVPHSALYNQDMESYWDGDGFCVWYKRLEKGTFQLPKVAANQLAAEIRSDELTMLLSGIDLSSVRRRKRYSVAS